ncbi:glycosyltransferase family 4 protein [Chitinophaga sp. 30R24]|uniref:glycosyltransferase family 4 protein n=1 Tax=Chitinophaga sp. 30R24 TaxID=3248838 RepID=UPI003B91CF3C
MKSKQAIQISFNGKTQAGGVERVVYYLDEYFRSRGIDSRVIDEEFLLHQTFFGKLLQQLFKYRHFRKRRTIYLARYTSAWLWLYKRTRYVVIVQGESTPFFPADFNFIHGSYHCMEVAYGRTDPRLSRIAALQQKTCNRAKQVVAVSDKVKQDLITWYQLRPDKIIVQNNCVDTARFHPIRKPASGRRTLLYVGRLVKEKGLAALQQLAPVIEQSQDWQLLIACNETPATSFFSAFTHTTVKVGLGIDNIAAEAYAAGDLLIVPSLFEGFELVTLEAMSVGIQVIGTRVGAISDLLDRQFPGVHLLPPDISYDDPAILAHFNKILDNAGLSVTPEALHQRVTQQFGIDAYMKKLDTILGPAFFHTT